jgi:hypothetical protein
MDGAKIRLDGFEDAFKRGGLAGDLAREFYEKRVNKRRRASRQKCRGMKRSGRLREHAN